MVAEFPANRLSGHHRIRRAVACYLLLVGAMLSTSAVAAEGGFTVIPGLPYSEADEMCRLDLSLPDHPTGNVPCVVVIQGGGFKSQTGQRFRPITAELARAGFAAALIGYRGLPDHTFDTTMADAKTAVRYVRKISRDHGIDPSRIGAMGRSAGATIALLLATTGNDPDYPSGDEHPGLPHALQAAAGIAGVYDFGERFSREDQRALQPHLEQKLRSNGQWIGAAFAPENERWELASARRQIDAGDPPLLLLHARDDETVPWQQTDRLHATAKEVGAPVRLHLTDTGGHRGPVDSMAQIVEFFKQALAE